MMECERSETTLIQSHVDQERGWRFGAWPENQMAGGFRDP